MKVDIMYNETGKPAAAMLRRFGKGINQCVVVN